MAPHLGHVSNFHRTKRVVVEPMKPLAFEKPADSSKASVLYGHPDRTRLELPVHTGCRPLAQSRTSKPAHECTSLGVDLASRTGGPVIQFRALGIARCHSLNPAANQSRKARGGAWRGGGRGGGPVLFEAVRALPSSGLEGLDGVPGLLDRTRPKSAHPVLLPTHGPQDRSEERRVG